MPVTQQFRIERFSAATASDAELRGRFELEDLLMREYDPDADTVPHERRLRLARASQAPYGAKEVVWVARAPDTRLVALAWLVRVRPRTPLDHARTCSALIGVHPGFRGRGLAKALLREIASFADRQGYDVMESVWKNDATRGFMGHLRGPTLTPKDGHRLRIADVPRSWLRQWIETGHARSPNARIDEFQGALPRSAAKAYLRAWTHLQSLEPLQIVEMRLDSIVERWYRQESARRESGEHWLSLVARDGDDQIMGLIEAVYSPQVPRVLLVRVCGALASYNGRGLRKWLQAELLLRVQAEFPGVAYVVHRQPPHGGRIPARLAASPMAAAADGDMFAIKDVLRRLG
jgi:GNAT superfamily N-acetyltransferase